MSEIEQKVLAGVDELVGRLQLGDLAAIPEAVTALQSLTATAREAEALRAENARLQARADAARRDALEEAAKVARDYASKAAQRGWVLKPGSIVTAARHIATTIRALKGNPNG